MDDPIWYALPAGARRPVDVDLAAGRHVQAIKAIRDASPEPPPGIPACMGVTADRMAELGLLPHGPTPLRAPQDGPARAGVNRSPGGGSRRWNGRPAACLRG
ncbi:hypothetical protein ACFV1W_27500 [Kitasatospora sp. NPDC059648]|uniref:hypothetical protein n=1 Tax=Kitasatospora sp. NPDC059648 TaxID=3346894 RepID=UPI0036865619